MKAVMLSIRPEWCAKIANGEKTVELRKSFPSADKVKTPFKCYIYCTSNTPVLWRYKGQTYLGNPFREWPGEIEPPLNGKVIGEFVCAAVLSHCEMANADLAEQMSCVRREKIREYSGGKEVFGWHISELVIYDEPKELSEFYVWKKCNSCRKSGYESTACGYDEDCKVPAIITRPPQSWCYVEEA